MVILDKFCKHIVYRVTFQYILRNCLPILAVKEMAEANPDLVDDVDGVFIRLQQAKKQVETLQNEIDSIKAIIKRCEKKITFSNVIAESAIGPSTSRAEASESTSWASFNSCDSTQEASSSDDQPSPKKVRYDFTECDGYVVVYTDGACENNGFNNAKAGIGVWWGKDHPLNVSKPVVGKATNNTAEIQACICAVEIARKNDIKKLQIVTDSQFTISSMTQWIRKWKTNDWKLANGGPVKNKTEFQKLDNLSEGMEIKWVHVRGHNSVPGNEAADELARMGAKYYVS